MRFPSSLQLAFSIQSRGSFEILSGRRIGTASIYNTTYEIRAVNAMSFQGTTLAIPWKHDTE